MVKKEVARVCALVQQLDSKDRRWRKLGNFSLAFALVLSNIFRPVGHSNSPGSGACFDALYNLLLGISIAVNLLLLRKARRRQI